jgi:NAD(P)-dependent dehydrogenase (short-subunit alcohol dehydrogenase family)
MAVTERETYMATHDPIFDVSGKTAIVTGASSGLGAMFARTLAERGANVVLAARREENLKQVQAEIESSGGSATSVVCDVAEVEQVQKALAVTKEVFGRPDILVCNAGTAADGGMMPEKVPHDVFEQVVKVNLTGVWHCCREVGAEMLSDRKGGSIINIASILGLSGQADYPVAYHASKAAVINMTRVLACSWSNRGVRVNAIAPGYFPSEMTDALLEIPSFRERVESQSAMARVGQPEELAGALLLLASGAGSFITGHTLAVDGGFSASIGATPFGPELGGIFAEMMPDGLGQRIGIE